MTSESFESDVARHERFRFGQNWTDFLRLVTDAHIEEAKKSLQSMLSLPDLAGKRFLDLGSGSGLFSLAAFQLGATKVLSLDYDPRSVACAVELRRRYADGDSHWEALEGSVLDEGLLARLGQWDIVYCWGVLHHTGSMWQGIDHAASCVAPNGLFFISIYNDQGRLSAFWRAVKAQYNRGFLGKAAVTSVFVPYFAVRGAVADLVRLRNPLMRYRNYRSQRAMSMVHDWYDWLGGYPFEVARPEEIVEGVLARSFTLRKLKTCGGSHGCNEFVFQKN